MEPDGFQADGILESTQSGHKFRFQKVSIKIKKYT